MKKYFNLVVALILFAGVCGITHADKTIVIVRHGEKPALGLGQLTCQGLNRSLALAPMILARFGKPQAIYAPNPAVLKRDHGVLYAYVRPLATIEPLAIRSGLPVDVEFSMTQVDALAKKLLDDPAGTSVVAWEHYWGETLAKRLLTKLGGNAAEVPTWKEGDYDSMYVIQVTDGRQDRGHPIFRLEKEGLDGMPKTCPSVSANPTR